MFFLQMSGVPGSGKSTLTKAIQEKINVVIVDHDVTKTALLEKVDGHLPMELAGPTSYHIDWVLIESFLAQNHSVIFDSPCLYSEMIEKGMRLAETYNASYKYVECLNEDFTNVNNRLKTRNRMVSQIKQIDTYDAFIKTVHYSKRPPNQNFLVVDSAKPIDTYIKSVIDYLQG